MTAPDSKSKTCAHCGKQVNRTLPNGRRLSNLEWLNRMFCDNPCRKAAMKRGGWGKSR